MATARRRSGTGSAASSPLSCFPVSSAPDSRGDREAVGQEVAGWAHSSRPPPGAAGTSVPLWSRPGGGPLPPSSPVCAVTSAVPCHRKPRLTTSFLLLRQIQTLEFTRECPGARAQSSCLSFVSEKPLDVGWWRPGRGAARVGLWPPLQTAGGCASASTARRTCRLAASGPHTWRTDGTPGPGATGPAAGRRSSGRRGAHASTLICSEWPVSSCSGGECPSA